MAKNIEPTLKLISTYLQLEKSAKFVIPNYQRAYSWGLDQCDKLWQDIEAFRTSESDDPYFFGTVIVDVSDSKTFSLIDGQQRTTTFLLLLKALLVRLNEVIPKISNDEESEPLKEGLKDNRKKIMGILYQAEAEDIPAMIKNPSSMQGIVILENHSINELYKDEVAKILAAVDFMDAEKHVAKLPRKQRDNKYTHHFRNFKFFYKELEKKDGSELNGFAKNFLGKCQIIEIRSWEVAQAITMFNSLNSTGMPLSDADIISAQMYSKSEDKTQFNTEWEKINHLVHELSHQKMVDMNSVLQQFMYIQRAKNNEFDASTPGLRRYYTEINSALLDQPMQLCADLLKIADAWDAIKTHPMVKLLLKFNENAKLFLASYVYRYDVAQLTDAIITDICECLLRLFVLLELDDTAYSSAKYKAFLFKENIRLVDAEIDFNAIEQDFNQHIGNEKNWRSEAVAEAIWVYEKNALVYLNEYLYAKEKGLPFDFADNVNIEHIMPSSGNNITSIQTDAGIEDKEEFKALVNQVGNKILLEENINKSIGNQWFKTKKQKTVSEKSGYKDSQYHIAAALQHYPKDVWEKSDIEAATDKATQRLIDFIFMQ
ncbi:DUF262 domain-containing protein [Vitreoscilla stercoraria]|uniref:DUF262 domain-containing HNH endonuclease family protein n=1 Tax=Vitreoscilla stercoraria TaxID=61 RepID=A0ABY4ECQ3_VITST|nr:DUF262 domain-containing protein [Vitreoscilla stercoraria]UOO93200.1 DUF262 domain-containing HNH endonuclease family protein [Vitreoscilla stercoraria]